MGELTGSEDGERGGILTQDQLLEEELLLVLLTLHRYSLRERRGRRGVEEGRVGEQR